MSTDAARDKAIRIEAQEDLYFFTRYMFKERRGYKWMQNWHHLEICEALMKVYRGEIKRLIINVPPRYSKTEIAVINFMAWCFGKNPDCEFIHISYSAMLAANNAFKYELLYKKRRIEKSFLSLHCVMIVRLKTSGELLKAVSAMRQVQAVRLLVLVQENFVKALVAALLLMTHIKHMKLHQNYSRRVIDWFQNTLESRTNSPDTPIIVIMQRLHEDDLAGWLLGDRKDGVPVAGGNGEVWEHLCLSAIQEDGSALWPAKHNIQKLRLMEQAAPYVFAGQYRQMPSPPAGGFFKPDNIQIVDALPADVVKQVRAWDFGATENEGDFTVGVREALGADGFTYIVDVTRGQLGPDNVNKRLEQTAKIDGKKVSVRLPQDPGQAGKSQASSFVKLLAGYSVIAKPISGDKLTRAQPFAAQVNVGNVRMLKGEWNKDFIDELRHFPNGTHDDQVDAASDAFNELHEGFEAFFADMGFAR
ncbi:hypothetical protein BANRA_00020 [Acinetobacter baumannii]|nr:hypothetical protein BANRA_00020 [Acinetobacter baumannii]